MTIEKIIKEYSPYAELISVEFNGDQHYKFTPWFHVPETDKSRQRHKKEFVRKRNVKASFNTIL